MLPIALGSSLAMVQRTLSAASSLFVPVFSVIIWDPLEVFW